MAAATLETHAEQPLAQKAARLRRIADVVMRSINDDIRQHRHTFTLLQSAPLSEGETAPATELHTSRALKRASSLHR